MSLYSACDGLFDKVSYQESVDLVHEGLRPHAISTTAQELVQYALLKHTTDNVSVIIACLGQTFMNDQ